MKIYGIGADIVKIDRINRSIKKKGFINGMQIEHLCQIKQIIDM